jgi:hypothetical protein
MKFSNVADTMAAAFFIALLVKVKNMVESQADL